MKMPKLYRSGKRFIKIYLGISLLTAVIIFILFTSSKNSFKTENQEQSIREITSFSNTFLDEISKVSTDIFLITDLIKIHDSLIISDGNTVFTSEYNESIIESQFLVWLEMKNIYDQIRIIDNNGQEVIRANYNSGDPYIVEDEDLQNKASRYYFTESIILQDNDLYMSVLDLNVENDEIEMIDGAPKPVLRLATPIFDDDGLKLGIMIVNYLVDDLFNTLASSEIDLNMEMEIINENGDYLYAIDKSKEFAFMYDDRSNMTFSDYHDYDIFTAIHGEIVNDDFEGETYTSIRVSGSELSNAANRLNLEDINFVLGDKEFIIFTEVDITSTIVYQKTVSMYVTISVISLFVFLILTRVIDESLYLSKENIKRMKYDSLHDLLTGLPNRKSIYEHIQYELQRNKQFTVLFIDFDGFKKVNDTFGHDIGDEALIQGSNRMKENIRFDDILGRIGGDEFIIVLKSLTDKNVVSRVCEKIILAFEKPFDLQGSIASMGVSIGACICDDNEYSIDDVISNSDKEMYKVKNSGKSNYSIFSD